MELTYETAMMELESIVRALQDDLVSMDELTAKAARAAYLVRWCSDALRTAEDQLQQLFEPPAADSF